LVLNFFNVNKFKSKIEIIFISKINFKLIVNEIYFKLFLKKDQ